MEVWFFSDMLHLHLRQCFNRCGRWGTTDDFTTSYLYFPLLSPAIWDLANSRPVHSLMLSSHLFLCLPCLLPPFTVPCKMFFCQTWWTGNMTIPLQFASLYDRQEVFSQSRKITRTACYSVESSVDCINFARGHLRLLLNHVLWANWSVVQMIVECCALYQLLWQPWTRERL